MLCCTLLLAMKVPAACNAAECSGNARCTIRRAGFMTRQCVAIECTSTMLYIPLLSVAASRSRLCQRAARYLERAIWRMHSSYSLRLSSCRWHYTRLLEFYLSIRLVTIPVPTRRHVSTPTTSKHLHSACIKLAAESMKVPSSLLGSCFVHLARFAGSPLTTQTQKRVVVEGG